MSERAVGDLFDLTTLMVDIPSESFAEGPLVEFLVGRLSAAGHLELTRLGDNLVARTNLGRPLRVILAGHTDTVAANGNREARVEGDVLWGVGSSDMKGGLAVMLQAALTFREPAVDVTFVFYAREEVAAVHSGLGEIVAVRPDLLQGDLALLGEPTDGAIEAGCQGSVRLEVVLHGARAHTARAWMGRNAIHRLGPMLSDVAAVEPRRPVIDGCEYHEAIQVVDVAGGVSGNVVPDRATLTVAHRFAPDRSPAQAEAWLRGVLAPHLEPDDEVRVVDVAPAAPPGLGEPLLASIIERHRLAVRAKLGWTDVARFAELGIPAANFGPGDATVAHTAGERLHRSSLDAVWRVTADLLETGLDGDR